MQAGATTSSDLPSGTITFLLSDIEGSSILWEEHPSEMEDALAAHDALAAEIMTAHDGQLLKHTGDGFWAVFRAASRALAAAVSYQRALAADARAAKVQLRVRIGVHTGDASPVNGDYMGPVMNRTAKLAAAGHGGQVLVSSTCKKVVEQASQPAPKLTDLGQHVLFPSALPEHIYQIVETGLASDFAALRTAGQPKSNLPAIASRFVGRSSELDALVADVADRRIVTITGPGGMGKTRLAYEVGRRMVTRFADGVWLVELADVDTPPAVIDSVLDSLSLRPDRQKDPVDAICDFLAAKQLLLIVDNCEHVLDPVGDCIEAITRRCPRVHVVTTSRVTLGLNGEVVCVIGGLELPDPSAAPSIQRSAEAVAFFCERAEDANHSFDPDSDVAAVSELCIRLDGMPLALELAAARLRLFSPRALVDRLDDVFGALSSRRRAATERHQTLESMMDWSFGLLDDEGRSLLAVASTFRAGFTAEALNAVAGSDPGGSEEDLARLVEASLVTVFEERFYLLEIVRQYASRRLAESGKYEKIRNEHTDYYTRLARLGNDELTQDPDKARTWWDTFEVEHDNFRASLEWAVQQGSANALSLANALSRFWYQIGEVGDVQGVDRSRHEEAERWLTDVLASTEQAPTSELLHVYSSLFFLSIWRGDVREAEAFAAHAQKVADQLPDPQLVAIALTLYGSLRITQGDYSAACDMFASCEELLRSEGGPDYREALMNIAFTCVWCGRIDQAERYAATMRDLARNSMGETLLHLASATRGFCAHYRGDLETAWSELTGALDGFRMNGVQPMAALSLRGLASTAHERGELDSAHDLAADSLTIARGSIYHFGELRSHMLLGQINASAGDIIGAKEHLSRALSLQPDGLDRSALMWGSIGCAVIARRESRQADAVRLLAAASGLRDRCGVAWPAPTAETVGGELADFREVLGHGRHAEAWSDGGAWSATELDAVLRQNTS